MEYISPRYLNEKMEVGLAPQTCRHSPGDALLLHTMGDKIRNLVLFTVEMMMVIMMVKMVMMMVVVVIMTSTLKCLNLTTKEAFTHL